MGFSKLTNSENINGRDVIGIDNLVKDTEAVKRGEKKRVFEYKLDDKAAKAKMVKGAKRIPFEVAANSSSSNLNFSLGAWSNVVLPSIRYLTQAKGSSCRVVDIIIKIADIKTGVDASGNQVDTQIIFFIDRDKVTCHFYNTTQRILVNGHGYARLIEVFLKPFFESKIALNLEDIKNFNEHALDTLGPKRVKRSDVRYTGGSTSLWCTKCDFAAKSRVALVRHKKTHHQSVSFNSKGSPSSSLALPVHHSTRNNSVASTRNNSILEIQMDEYLTIADIPNDEKKETVNAELKYTCTDCNYKTKVKAHMDEHVTSVHKSGESKEVDFICGKCKHRFYEADNYNEHLKRHDDQKIILDVPIELLDDTESGVSENELEEKVDSPKKKVDSPEKTKYQCYCEGSRCRGVC